MGRLFGRIKASLLLAGAAGLVVVAVVAVVAVAAVVVLGGGGATRTATARPPLARPFTLAMLGDGGKQVSLAAYAGRPVVLNFFASWCGPCQRETPLLAGFYRAHGGRVLVIGVDAFDRLGAASAFVRAHGVGYPVAFDSSTAVAVSYGVIALPQTLFLNARHQIVRHVYGALTLRELDSWATALPR